MKKFNSIGNSMDSKVAIRWIKSAQESIEFQDCKWDVNATIFGSDTTQEVLSQEGCDGIILIPIVKDGIGTLIICGIDRNGDIMIHNSSKKSDNFGSKPVVKFDGYNQPIKLLNLD